MSRADALPHRAALRRAALRWFRRYRRDLPWRRTRDPYAIWVSETMLQQTQVAIVIPYYERFMARFPTVAALAAARLDEVLRVWAGMGYYARARNLHAAARRIVEHHDGRLPDTVAELAALPGVGRYTAGAVASIAFGRRAAVLDGNVARLLSRVFGLRSDPKTPRAREKLWALAESLAPRRHCGDFNQALMELGATVCTPRSPNCPGCPLARQCRALALAAVERIPGSARRRSARVEMHAVVAIRHRARWLFVRRPESGLWGGLWELPSAVCGRRSARAAAVRLAGRWAPGAVVAARPFCRLERQLSHRTILFVAYVARASNAARVAGAKWWMFDSIDRVGVSRAMLQIISELRRGSATGRARRA